ncbi:MAG: transposase domain-containing protein [Spirochaetaceae bacterium]|jgi:hypothetical protein|nr:transposase domain-containing protein [Spirochaetaceae bacterium]
MCFSSCRLYALIETAKAHGKNYDYLKYIFEQAPLIKTNDDWPHLLPWNLHG